MRLVWMMADISESKRPCVRVFAPLSHGRKVSPSMPGRVWQALLALFVLAGVAATVVWLVVPDDVPSRLFGVLVAGGVAAAVLYGVAWLAGHALGYATFNATLLFGAETIQEYLEAGALVADIRERRPTVPRSVRRQVARAADQALWLYALALKKRIWAVSQQGLHREQRQGSRGAAFSAADALDAAEIREQHAFEARAALALLQELYTTVNDRLPPAEHAARLREVARRIQDADTAAALGPHGIRLSRMNWKPPVMPDF